MNRTSPNGTRRGHRKLIGFLTLLAVHFLARIIALHQEMHEYEFNKGLSGNGGQMPTFTNLMVDDFWEDVMYHGLAVLAIGLVVLVLLVIVLFRSIGEDGPEPQPSGVPSRGPDPTLPGAIANAATMASTQTTVSITQSIINP